MTDAAPPPVPQSVMDAARGKRSGEAKAINCTTCGASLPALAGHKAKALVCSYCGSVMDRHDDYKVLARYRDMRRPAGPLMIGMEGEVLGVRHTVVGIVGMSTRVEGETYRWTDYQIYAPTHGYSWLTWYDGHLVHSRKVREPVDVDPIRGFVPKAEFDAAGDTFTMFEQTVARIDYIEGELTWVPKLGDETPVIEAISPPYGFAVSRGEVEQETELMTYLERDAVLESFGVDVTELPAPGGVHAIQPFEPGHTHSALAQVAKWFLPGLALAALALWLFGGGSTVARAFIQDPAKGGVLEFEAPGSTTLMAIDIEAPLSNEWAWYEMSLQHVESGEDVAEFGEGLEYYSGYEGGESWSEGSRSATLRFRPPQEGLYRLTLQADPQSPALTRPVQVEVRSNVFVARWFLLLAVVALVLWASLAFRRHSFETRRWGGGDEEDDDD